MKTLKTNNRGDISRAWKLLAVRCIELGRRIKLCAQMWRGYYGATRTAGNGITFSFLNACSLAHEWLVENPPTAQAQRPQEENEYGN